GTRAMFTGAVNRIASAPFYKQPATIPCMAECSSRQSQKPSIPKDVLMKKLLAFATAGLIATGAFAQAPAAAPTDAPAVKAASAKHTKKATKHKVAHKAKAKKSVKAA
ncbi:MAG: hypothetical protein ACLGJD_07455, partial [Gammaproteobacteria bacterium]